jgi:starvation-inducible DNA-binding protein
MSAKAQRNSNTQMAEHLIDVLSDTYLLMIKTHGYHWNVTGPLFPQLHTLFEGQYNELFGAADEIAERIRALDFPAPGSTGAFNDNTVVKEAGDGQPLKASAMLKDLVKTHEQVRDRVEEARALAGEIADTATEDLMNKRLAAHDKDIWMLRSTIAA